MSLLRTFHSTVSVTTDAVGSALATINVTAAVDEAGAAPAADGDTLQVTAVWIGPTGERVTEVLRRPLADAAVRLAVQTVPQQPLPGVPFQVAVQATTVVPGVRCVCVSACRVCVGVPAGA